MVTAASALAAARCAVASCISSSPPSVVYKGSLQHFKFWFPLRRKGGWLVSEYEDRFKMFYNRSWQDGWTRCEYLNLGCSCLCRVLFCAMQSIEQTHCRSIVCLSKNNKETHRLDLTAALYVNTCSTLHAVILDLCGTSTVTWYCQHVALYLSDTRVLVLLPVLLLKKPWAPAGFGCSRYPVPLCTVRAGSMCVCGCASVCASFLARSGVIHWRAYSVFYQMPNAPSSVISSSNNRSLCERAGRRAASSHVLGRRRSAREWSRTRLLGLLKENRRKSIDTLQTIVTSLRWEAHYKWLEKKNISFHNDAFISVQDCISIWMTLLRNSLFAQCSEKYRDGKASIFRLLTAENYRQSL